MDASPRRYYPRMLWLAPQGMSMTSDRWFELLVVGRDKVGALARLAAVLAEHEINLVPSGGYQVDRDTFIWTTFLNFGHSNSPVERVIKEMKRLDFVTEAEAVEVKGAAMDEFLFPVVIGGRFRGIILSLAPLLNIERKLTEMLNSSGAVLMFEEGKSYAIESLAQLREVVPETDSAKLLGVVEAWLRTTGWGRFAFDATKLVKEHIITVLVKEPPNALMEPKRQSHFLNGVVAGVIEAVFSKKAALVESDYEEAAETLRLDFRIA